MIGSLVLFFSFWPVPVWRSACCLCRASSLRRSRLHRGQSWFSLTRSLRYSAWMNCGGEEALFNTNTFCFGCIYKIMIIFHTGITQEHNLLFHSVVYVTASMQSIRPDMGLCTYTALESSGPEVDSSPASWSTSSSSSSSVVSESSLDEE